MLQGAFKIQAFHFHHKAIDIATLAATKIMPNILIGTDEKAGRALTRKRAQALKVAAGAPELHILAYHIFDIEPCADVFFGLLHTPYYTTLGSQNAPPATCA